MNEQTEKLIRELADKLGTTSEHLWQVLVNQAHIAGIVSIIQLVFLLVLAAIVASAFKWCHDHDDHNAAPVLFVIGIVTGFVVIVLGMVWIGELDLTIASFFNPEYWALKQIIK